MIENDDFFKFFMLDASIGSTNALEIHRKHFQTEFLTSKDKKIFSILKQPSRHPSRATKCQLNSS